MPSLPRALWVRLCVSNGPPGGTCLLPQSSLGGSDGAGGAPRPGCQEAFARQVATGRAGCSPWGQASEGGRWSSPGQGGRCPVKVTSRQTGLRGRPGPPPRQRPPSRPGGPAPEPRPCVRLGLRPPQRPGPERPSAPLHRLLPLAGGECGAAGPGSGAGSLSLGCDEPARLGLSCSRSHPGWHRGLDRGRGSGCGPELGCGGVTREGGRGWEGF